MKSEGVEDEIGKLEREREKPIVRKGNRKRIQ